jgi:hypothetical protein
LFRLLTEEHIPFAVSDNMDWVGKARFRFWLSLPIGRLPGLKQYAENGGRVLIVSARPTRVRRCARSQTIPEIRGYVRVRDHAAFSHR